MDTEKNTAENEADSSYLLKVRFNRQNFSLDEENAARYAEMGMKFEQLRPTLAKAQYMAARQNMSLAQLVEDEYSQLEERLKNSVLEKCGGDEQLAGQLAELEQSKLQKEYDRMMEYQDNDGGFAELAGAFPDIDSPEKVPEQVRMDAATHNIPLLHAYLKYRYDCESAAAAETAAQANDAQMSAGKMKYTEDDGTSSIDALLRGIYNAAL